MRLGRVAKKAKKEKKKEKKLRDVTSHIFAQTKCDSAVQRSNCSCTSSGSYSAIIVTVLLYLTSHVVLAVFFSVSVAVKVLKF